MEPLPDGPIDDLTGMNVSYDRAALAAIDDLLREGRWETWLHPRLRERGFELYCSAGMVLEHDKDFGLGEFLCAALALQPVVRGHAQRDARPEALALRARRPAAAAAPLLPHRAERPRARRLRAAVRCSRRRSSSPTRSPGRSARLSGTSRAGATACSRCGRPPSEGRCRRDELDEQARLRALRAQCRRPPRRDRCGVELHAVHRRGVGERGRAAGAADVCAVARSQGAVGGGVRPVVPAAVRHAPAVARRPRVQTSTSCSSRRSTRGFPSSARRRWSASTT